MSCRHRRRRRDRISFRRGGARAGYGAAARRGCIIPRSSRLKSLGGRRGERRRASSLSSSIRSSLIIDRVVSIAAGRDHLLALTSSGRTFVHPMTKDANSHGQLGFRKFDIPDPSSAGTSASRLHVELTPRAVADPYAKSSRYPRESRQSATGLLPVSENLDDVDDKNLKFSDKFFEVPALKGINVVQIAACARSSFVRTDAGRVLGWGANDYGYVLTTPLIFITMSRVNPFLTVTTPEQANRSRRQRDT
jgi:hypothetical protein